MIDEEWHIYDALRDDEDTSYSDTMDISKLLNELDKIFNTHSNVTPPGPSSPMILCECGAEKCNTGHSDWCPKYKI